MYVRHWPWQDLREQNFLLPLCLPVLDNVFHVCKLLVIFGGMEGKERGGGRGRQLMTIQRIAHQCLDTFPWLNNRFSRTFVPKLGLCKLNYTQQASRPRGDFCRTISQTEAGGSCCVFDVNPSFHMSEDAHHQRKVQR